MHTRREFLTLIGEATLAASLVSCISHEAESINQGATLSPEGISAIVVDVFTEGEVSAEHANTRLILEAQQVEGRMSYLLNQRGVKTLKSSLGLGFEDSIIGQTVGIEYHAAEYAGTKVVDRVYAP